MESFKQNLKIKTVNGKTGVFSLVHIPADTVVFEFTGNILQLSDIPNPLIPENDHYLQVDINKYIGPSGDFDDVFNHSCDPNCGLRVVGKRALLISIYEIKVGDELTFDYSTSSLETKDTWQLECKCGSWICRKIISGFQYLPEERKNYYKKLKLIPKYLEAV